MRTWNTRCLGTVDGPFPIRQISFAGLKVACYAMLLYVLCIWRRQFIWRTRRYGRTENKTGLQKRLITSISHTFTRNTWRCSRKPAKSKTQLHERRCCTMHLSERIVT